MSDLFEFRARNASGASERGVVFAGTREDALRDLRLRNLTPLSLERQSPEARIVLSDETARDLAKTLAHLLRSGLSLSQGLHLAAQELDKSGASAALALKEAAERGRPLIEGLATFQGSAAELLKGVLVAGSESSQLARALELAGATLHRSAELKARLRTGMVYPVFVLISSLGTLIGFLWFVVPTLASALASNIGALPWSTRALLSLSSWLKGNSDQIVMGLAGLIMLALAPPVRRGAERVLAWLLASPLSFGIPRRFELASWASLAALSLETGSTAVAAFEAAIVGVRQKSLAQQLRAAIERMRIGDRPAFALAQCVAPPPIMLRLLQVGEETGRAAEAMAHASEALVREAEQRLTRLGAISGPAVTLFLGAIVAAMVLSLFLGLLSISDQVAL